MENLQKMKKEDLVWAKNHKQVLGNDIKIIEHDMEDL
jgi:hypothetical protein